MSTATAPASAWRLPDDYTTAALESQAERPVLRIGVVVRKEPDPAGGSFVLLQETEDARVYLGVLQDQRDRVLDYLEVWVQSMARIDLRAVGHEAPYYNAEQDRLWDEKLRAFEALDPDAFIDASERNDRRIALVLDLDAMRIQPAGTADSAPWELCTEDMFLETAQLPGYGASPHRYLYQPADLDNTFFLPLNEEAPRNENTKEVADALGLNETLVPFNLEGGRLMLRRLAPLGLDAFARLLAGQPWKGEDQARKPFVPAGVAEAFQDVHLVRETGGHLFRGGHGQTAFLTEVFYLKMALLSELFAGVREATRRLQLPFLNINPEHFRIRLGAANRFLPSLWSFKVCLERPADTFALPVPTSDTRFFKTNRKGVSIYAPEALSAQVTATGSLRIRYVKELGGGEVLIEGTLVTQERLDAFSSDLVYLRIPVRDRDLDFFAEVSSKESLARGEVRFASLPREISADDLTALNELSGVQLPRIYFELMPVMRTPCDVFSLAVIGVQLFLSNDANPLPVALDECLSLGRELANGYAEDVAPLDRLYRLVQADGKWLDLLGPHHLLAEDLQPETAAESIPADLWWEFILTVIRSFPALGPDSYHRDYGDVSPFALESAFDPPLADIERLLRKARSLLIIDWNQNREIAGLIESFRQP